MIVIQWIEFMTNLFSGSNLAFSFDSSWLSAIESILSFISWVIPIDVVVYCFGVSLGILLIRVIVSIWKLLPLT